MKFPSILLLTLVMLLVAKVSAPAMADEITQQVLLPGGQPAKGAEVFLHSDKDSDVQVKTDEQGYFSLPIAPDAKLYGSLVVVDMPGYALSLTQAVSGKNPNPMQLLTDKPRVGKVVDTNNQAVAGAQVIVTIYGLSDYWTPLELQSPYKITVPQLVARTDDKGNFSLRGLNTDLRNRSGVSGWAKTTINGKMWLGAWSENKDKEPTKDLVIQIKPTISVQGKLVNEAIEKPIIGAKIDYFSQSLQREQTAQTREDGRFELCDLPADEGRYFDILLPNSEKISVNFRETKDNDIERPFVLSIPQTTKVSGQINDVENGRPLTIKTRIRVQWRQDSNPDWSLSSSKEIVTNENSNFSLPILTGNTGIYVDMHLDNHSRLMEMRLHIPANGIKPLNLAVSVPPLYRVRQEKEMEGAFRIYRRTETGEEGVDYARGDKELVLFAQKWDETMEIRGVNVDYDKEAFGWTKITAARDLQINIFSPKY